MINTQCASFRDAATVLSKAIAASVVACVLTAVTVASPVRAAELKLGVFDSTKILANSKMGQSLQEELNRFRIQREGDIKKEREELEKLFAQYKTAVDTMSDERKEGVEGDLGQRRRDLERLVQDSEQDLQRKRRKGLSDLEQSVAQVIDDYAKRNGFTLILQREICAFALDTIDISDDIIELIDKLPRPTSLGQ